MALKYLNFKGLKYLFSRGLRFIWQGTAEEWEALTEQEQDMYDAAWTIDPPSDEPEEPKIWQGTQAEWDALTDAEKDEWDIAFIEDETTAA